MGKVQNGDNGLKDFTLQRRIRMSTWNNSIREELVPPLWSKVAVLALKFVHIRMNYISQGAA